MTSSTAKIQGVIGMSKKPTTINNNKLRAIGAAGLSFENGRVTTRVPANITVSGGGKLSWVGKDRAESSPERIAKATMFFERQIAMRKNPACCPRCGAERGKEFRTCDKCRDSIRKSKLRAKGIAVVKGGEYSNADLAAMVIQMRREMDKMQVRFKLWQKAADYRRNLHYRTNTMRKKYLKTFSPAEAMDYLAETNHAYENQELEA